MTVREAIDRIVGFVRRPAEPSTQATDRRQPPDDRPTLEEGDADGRELKEATDRAREEMRRVGRG
jgi:cell division protein FtsN